LKLPKRKFDKLRTDEAIAREKAWRKQMQDMRREGRAIIEEGWEAWEKKRDVAR
jgi:hypothetical protein